MKSRSGETIKLTSIDELLGVVNEESAMENRNKQNEKYQLLGPFDQPKTPEVKKVLNDKKVSDHHAIIPTVELAEF